MRNIKGFMFTMVVFILLPVKSSPRDLTFLSHELKPFTWTDNGTTEGLVYDLVHATMVKMNVKREIKIVPFTRGLSMVQNEPDTVLFHVQRTPERERTMKWVGPIVTNGVYVYCSKSSAGKIRNLDDLRKLKYIAVVNGEATDEFFRKNGFRNQFYVRQQSQSLEMLVTGRVEASPFGEMVVGAYARDAKLDISRIEKTGIRLFESVLYMGFSNNVPDDEIRKWQKALDEVKREQYERLYEKYIRNQ